MKTAVRYFTRGGNTKKIAEAIAGAAGVPAEPVSVPLEEDIDILFLGSSPYAFDVDNAVKDFISGISVRVGQAVSFSTAAVIKSTRKYTAPLLEAKGIPVSEEEFACRGSFTVLHRGHPDEEDCRAAAEFARKILSKR